MCAQIATKPVVLRIQLDQGLGIVDRAFELGAIPDQARICHQRVDVTRVEI